MRAGIGTALGNILWLTIKELRVLRADPVLLLLVAYTFTAAVYTVATGVKTEVRNAAVAVVDEDRSGLSRAVVAALLPPLFQPPVPLAPAEVAPALDAGRFVFVLQLPPRFESDLLAARPVNLGLDVDATAMAQAGNGAAYIQQIVQSTVAERLGSPPSPIELVIRLRFNPNGLPEWFTSVMQVMNSTLILSIILPGAALLREREHGTLEHLLAMPVTPLQILLAKIGANALVIVTAAILSLLLVVRGLLGVPIAGSVPLFVVGTMLFQVSVAALGVLLATMTSSTGQFGLLALPAFILMMLLSGSMTPLESMPGWLQHAVQVLPTTQFVAFAQSVLFRGAGLDIVAPRLAALAVLGVLFLGGAYLRLRDTLAS
ncbi:ABC transporter permease [Roseomonas sp. NAR14]|uniref:ABC transporter permease n=1 Tax=Roseomonas acroporae TaxID=2937791 RepID=A0A9X1YCL3_9PROT|nr:ABC transporter permease [Roseomonas acroporae]MCK8787683.1 ABC transporter permease [Roseomonas acroporae]